MPEIYTKSSSEKGRIIGSVDIKKVYNLVMTNKAHIFGKSICFGINIKVK